VTGAALARAIDRRCARTRGRFTRVIAPFPRIDLPTLFAARDDAAYLATPTETRLALGAAARLNGAGPSRFSQLQAAARSLPRDARLYFLGSFDDAMARAVLPRLELVQDATTTTLVVTVDRDAPAPDLGAELDDLITASRTTATARAPRLLRGPSADDDTAFAALVTRARDRIRAGDLAKVVVHRSSRFTLDAQPALAAALRALAARQTTATRYGFKVDGATFLGATPERLVRRIGDRVEADVLAGSIARAPGVDGLGLLCSAKDRAEHALTRRAIGETIAARCTNIALWGPTVRTLPHVYHLHTRVEGRLARPTHVLELVAALHPTPAVGGVPSAAALAFLAAHERAPRGWYEGPVGWFSPGGDGDISVALRAALVEGTTITLYAGAGVVAASEPTRELAETIAKSRTMAEALGLPGDET
jgi:isochorismate synthase